MFLLGAERRLRCRDGAETTANSPQSPHHTLTCSAGQPVFFEADAPAAASHKPKPFFLVVNGSTGEYAQLQELLLNPDTQTAPRALSKVYGLPLSSTDIRSGPDGPEGGKHITKCAYDVQRTVSPETGDWTQETGRSND